MLLILRDQLLTQGVTAKAIKTHPIIEGTAEKSIVTFLPYLLTINDEIIEPIDAPMLNKEDTQEASSEFNFTGESLCNSNGIDGEDHPKKSPVDNIPKFPEKLHFH